MKFWFGIDLWKRVLMGLVLGAVTGIVIRQVMGPEAAGTFVTGNIKPFGNAFISLIKMLVVPLIFTTLVSGVLAMGDPKKLGSLGGRALALYMGTTVIAICFGLLIGTLVQPGAGFDTSIVSSADLEATRATLANNPPAGSVGEQLMKTLLSIIPENPVAAFAKGDVLQIIFFAILFGVGVLMSGEAGKPVQRLFDSASEAVMRMTLIVMEAAPFGVFALMVWVLAQYGFGVLTVLGKMTASLYIACALHMLITYGFIIKGMVRLPVLAFFRGAVDAQALAFSTSSSNATLPMTMSCATKNLGIGKPVASSVLPLGATINMDGTALYQGLIALFAVQALGIPVTASMYVTIILMATLVSIGTAGVPSVSLLLATTTLGIVGATAEQTVLIIALLFPFDRILDMMRTVTNITGDLAVATAVAKWEGELDEDVFRAPDRV
ncbi:MAG: dicarboxylate/amino acid:cation symporter [Hyphomonas sp.]|uniref:dicarboxylate/amino acid:cation symporter n=1 Tax=Hyphomonas sp. TaxID=87 RepID=UPI0017CC9C0B|nr:dicarboxylate/amino acid:cation symporter [Hyphomonas sp.]MBU3919584.1 dicarboxylate/amino acid:cation symporter [Alphaproteobacteria bacterium]MBA3068417.1 dicarboxylate/amino acid:cation symporter [Hyphomonas sp.]MBU4060715.1 dicarboxylate/amino acid:cation symporter [Alphaproteobacteria bacterium]MBU4164699.1 dicarboxylate/amino acid:cation symporter [Alphaproteobacteria bacterium]MBU4568044.1 dicarboxylate/amino acid:cation symporter [Alphaproteobacteria bacterium]